MSTYLPVFWTWVTVEVYNLFDHVTIVWRVCFVGPNFRFIHSPSFKNENLMHEVGVLE